MIVCVIAVPGQLFAVGVTVIVPVETPVQAVAVELVVAVMPFVRFTVKFKVLEQPADASFSKDAAQGRVQGRFRDPALNKAKWPPPVSAGAAQGSSAREV